MKNSFINEESFQWDIANLAHIQKHNVTYSDCEEIFTNAPLIIFPDERHSQKEKRFGVLGKTNQQRELAVVFTLRGKMIRVISARDQSRKERDIYKKEEKNMREVKTYEKIKKSSEI